MTERTPPGPPERHRWVFRFRVEGDVRFISHHDTLRLFRRALARADLPVKFSEGFNPGPRISIPVPRPVGIASDDEALVVEFERAIDGAGAIELLNSQMPSGVTVMDARRLLPGEQVQPDVVRYRLAVNGDAPPGLSDMATKLLDAASLPVQRRETSSGVPRTIDVRPYLAELTVTDGGVDFALRVTGAGTARPSEIAGLLSFDPTAINHRIRRISVIWKA